MTAPSKYNPHGYGTAYRTYAGFKSAWDRHETARKCLALSIAEERKASAASEKATSRYKKNPTPENRKLFDATLKEEHDAETRVKYWMKEEKESAEMVKLQGKAYNAKKTK